MGLVAFIGFVLVTVEISRDRPPIPQGIAVLGDSISEGMLAEYSLERPPTLRQWLGVLRQLNDSAGLDALTIFRKLFAKAWHSWATGDDRSDIVFSHYERLRRLNPDLKNYNFSVSGAKSQELELQVEEFIEAEANSGQSIDYVIVLVGANDLNVAQKEHLMPPMSYGFNVEMGLRRILSRDARRAVLIVSIPKVHEILERSSAFPVYKVAGKKIRCDVVRRKIYGNRPLFEKPGTMDYQATRMMAEMYRNEVDRVADRLREDFPASHIKAIRNYDEPRYDRKTLSVDCFHPSMMGQALLAELTWRESFWADPVSEEDALDW